MYIYSNGYTYRSKKYTNLFNTQIYSCLDVLLASPSAPYVSSTILSQVPLKFNKPPFFKISLTLHVNSKWGRKYLEQVLLISSN